MTTDTALTYGMTRTQALALVWRTTHRDFRSSPGYPRAILTAKGIVALEQLEGEEYESRVRSGLQWVNHQQFKRQGLTVYPRGEQAWCGAIDHDGGAHVVNLMTGESKRVAEPDMRLTGDDRLWAAALASESAAKAMA